MKFEEWKKELEEFLGRTVEATVGLFLAHSEGSSPREVAESWVTV